MVSLWGDDKYDLSFDDVEMYFDMAAAYARKYSTCLKVQVGSLFLCNRTDVGSRIYLTCNSTGDESKNCKINGECHKYKVTGIYESCEETRKYCSSIHSEINMIDLLKREIISPDKGILFVTRYPCVNCANEIVEAGFKTVAYCGRQEISDEVRKIFDDGNVDYYWENILDYEYEED